MCRDITSIDCLLSRFWEVWAGFNICSYVSVLFPHIEGITLGKDTFRGALEFKDVEFAYPTRPETSIFKDFSLSIPAGSVMALVGSSGAGKSTIVSLLLRLYDPIAGMFCMLFWFDKWCFVSLIHLINIWGSCTEVLMGPSHRCRCASLWAMWSACGGACITLHLWSAVTASWDVCIQGSLFSAVYFASSVRVRTPLTLLFLYFKVLSLLTALTFVS